MKRTFGVLCAAGIFILLLLFPDAAATSALNGLRVCAKVVIPSLFPFFVAAGLLTETGAVNALAELLSPVCARLFGVSGHGGTAFIIGLSGGYPLGAAFLADKYRKKEISDADADALAVFCNNSGPAFILGAAGSAVFHSTAIGLFLYAVHILAAVLGGIILSERKGGAYEAPLAVSSVSFSKAFTHAVKNAVRSCLSVCGFIGFFTVVTGILDETGLLMAVSAYLARMTGTELGFMRAFFCGLIELGGGITAMSGLPATPLSLALASFILSWGSLSVHFQSLAMLDGIKIRTARYILGRLLIACIAAALALFGAMLFF